MLQKQQDACPRDVNCPVSTRVHEFIPNCAASGVKSRHPHCGCSGEGAVSRQTRGLRKPLRLYWRSPRVAEGSLIVGAGMLAAVRLILAMEPLCRSSLTAQSVRNAWSSVPSRATAESPSIAAASTASGTWERVAYAPPERFCRPRISPKPASPSPYPGRRSRQSCDPNAPTNKPQAQVVKAIVQRFFGRSEHQESPGRVPCRRRALKIHE